MVQMLLSHSCHPVNCVCQHFPPVPWILTAALVFAFAAALCPLQEARHVQLFGYVTCRVQQCREEGVSDVPVPKPPLPPPLWASVLLRWWCWGWPEALLLRAALATSSTGSWSPFSPPPELGREQALLPGRDASYMSSCPPVGCRCDCLQAAGYMWIGLRLPASPLLVLPSSSCAWFGLKWYSVLPSL